MVRHLSDSTSTSKSPSQSWSHPDAHAGFFQMLKWPLMCARQHDGDIDVAYLASVCFEGVSKLLHVCPCFVCFRHVHVVSLVWSLVLCHMVSDTSVPCCVSCVVLRAAVRDGFETGVPWFTNVHRHTNTLVEFRPRLLMARNGRGLCRMLSNVRILGSDNGFCLVWQRLGGRMPLQRLISRERSHCMHGC